ncbi:MAG: hypothetical protein EOO88_39165 [Pedobacter sp.]|nr:MAG: hypothetical protein EOO88_39165 [Pedobacter sp.]
MGRREYISLTEELALMEQYLLLEQKRHPFTFEITNRSSIDLSQVDFPALLLQPIIENSIHHGFTKDIVMPAVSIAVEKENEALKIIIADNGRGFDQVSTLYGHGLSLVQRRILLLNETRTFNVEMKIKSASNMGTTTTITLTNWM